MNALRKAVVIAGLAGVAAVLPVAGASAEPAAGPAQVTAMPADVITTCGKGFSGYMRRAGKDALCLKPGTRTWTGFKAFECRGKLTLHFKDGTRINCGGTGVNFPDHGGVVKTVAYA
ncbi:hypothetical protein ACFS2C_20400 [Prauserella oleivorans]|uniref:Uncharacterized protein n=1 Tax=Prauserella oleivorans TaxID=1478153 RepID=A0ABW5WFE6_9PSEU